jgi:outer membrane protein assembly factor BamB
MSARIRRHLAWTTAVGCLLAAFATQATATDWPQILGPDRNGKAPGERLADAWPEDGPKPLWSKPLGSGYAGVAVAAGKVIAFHRIGELERVEALDASSGRSLWQRDFHAAYRGGIDVDKGPRCVPLIADGTVYVFGAAGDLHAVSLDQGNHLWSRPLYEELAGDEGYFGAGSTPILAGGKLLVNVGGRRAGIVAVHPKSGETAWQASDEAASYSSPALVRVAGKEQALFVTRLNCVLVDPTAGTVKNLFPFGQRGPTVNAATPLVLGDKVFTTASYNVGAKLAALTSNGAKEIWASDDILSSQYATPVEHEGFLYGIHGREDIGVAALRCVEAATGKIRWSEEGFGVAHIILADGKLLLQKADGTLVLAAADPSHFRRLAGFKLDAESARALPALSAGRLYVRTGSGGGKLVCLPVGK